MDRRTYLAGISAGVAGLAGCLGGSGDEPSAENGAVETETPTSQTVSVQGRGEVELPVPRSELVWAASVDVFPAITDPVFGSDWAGIELDGYGGDAATPRLVPSDRVVGVERDGEARAYPLRLFAAHEVVNDEFGGPLLITYCPLCGSGVVARRVVDGAATLFGVSGRLWQSDLVLYDDRTQSLWSQLLATAIRGEQTGSQLELVPSTLTTWGQWREVHPDTRVVRPPPESGTIDGSGPQYYGTERYETHKESDSIGVGQNEFSDDRLHPKTEVVGVVDGESARAYPLPSVREAGVVNDTVGDLPVVVAITGSTLVAYDRSVDGTVLTFERVDDTSLTAGGSRWETLTGRAVDGSYEGLKLSSAAERSQLFWFAWLDFFPETELYTP